MGVGIVPTWEVWTQEEGSYPIMAWTNFGARFGSNPGFAMRQGTPDLALSQLMSSQFGWVCGCSGLLREKSDPGDPEPGWKVRMIAMQSVNCRWPTVFWTTLSWDWRVLTLSVLDSPCEKGSMSARRWSRVSSCFRYVWLCTSPASKLQTQCGEFIRGTCLSLKSAFGPTCPSDNDEQTCEASGEESGGLTQQTFAKLGGNVNP